MVVSGCNMPSCSDIAGNLLNVTSSDTSNRDTSVHGTVDRVLLGQSGNLLGLEAGVGKHTDLGGDVIPVVLGTKFLEVALQKRTHSDNAVRHSLDLGEPLLVEGSVVQNLRSNASSVNGGVRVHRADEDLDLRVNALPLLSGLGEDGEGTDTLSVETLHAVSYISRIIVIPGITYHVLGEGLAQGNLVTLLDKVPEGVGVLVGIAGSESLVCHVEEGEVTTVLDRGGDDSPLLGGGVNSGRVVCTSVQQEDRILRGILDVCQKTVDIETDGLLVVVSVCLYIKPTVVEDCLVVCPRGVGEVDSLRVGVVSLEEGTSDSQGSGSGNGLRDGNIVKDGALRTVREDSGGLGESGDTSDSGVLLVESLLEDALLSSADRGQDVGLAGIITVCTDSWSQVSLSCGCHWQLCAEGTVCIYAPRLIFLGLVSALKASVIPVIVSSRALVKL